MRRPPAQSYVGPIFLHSSPPPRRMRKRREVCTCLACHAPSTLMQSSAHDVPRVQLPAHLLYGAPDAAHGNVVASVLCRLGGGKYKFVFPDGRQADKITDATRVARKRSSITVLCRTDPWKEWYVFDGTRHIRSDSVQFVAADEEVDSDDVGAEWTDRSHVCKRAPDVLCVAARKKSRVLDEAAPRLTRNGATFAVDVPPPVKATPSLSSNATFEQPSGANFRTIPACRWTSGILPLLLWNAQDAPDVNRINYMDDVVAECEFVHPDGTVVPIVVPLCSIYHVEKYQPLLAPIKRRLNDA